LVGGTRSYDSDNERVVGDVGMAGVAIDSVEDMKVRVCSAVSYNVANCASRFFPFFFHFLFVTAAV
jgi:methylmalonyl-CoA mutase N-terminal domain/subunit